MGGQHVSPKPGTDLFMAVALLPAAVIPAALGG
jgi:hypothetical protein